MDPSISERYFYFRVLNEGRFIVRIQLFQRFNNLILKDKFANYGIALDPTIIELDIM